MAMAYKLNFYKNALLLTLANNPSTKAYLNFGLLKQANELEKLNVAHLQLTVFIDSYIAWL